MILKALFGGLCFYDPDIIKAQAYACAFIMRGVT